MRLAQLGDDRILAEMTRRVFCAGFAWRVIEAKWDGLEDAFLRFQPDDYWEGLLRDARIVRNARRSCRCATAQFNAWAEETGLPYAYLSRICALSIGKASSKE